MSKQIMEISKIAITRFKAIDYIEYEPKSINLLVGENNSGKSSFLQAIQFAVSVIQAAYANSTANYKNDAKSTSLSFSALDYSPAKDVTTIVHGAARMQQGVDKGIMVEFFAVDPNKKREHRAAVIVRRGKNSNLAVKLEGKTLCDYIASPDHNFSMYVPGLAGVPFDEHYQAKGAVRRAAAKGDANTILRNVLLLLKDDKENWASFINDVNQFFPNTTISVDGRLDIDGIIEAMIDCNGVRKSIETIGTGLLQTIQIAAYMNYFKPDILLLDEPDSHLHPNNQQLLGQIIKRYAEENYRVFVATHSRYLMSTLRISAQMSFIVEGRNTPFDDECQILMELGALDKYSAYKDPDLKYVILVEDTGKESISEIELILLASGLSKNSYTIHHYNGSDQVLSARFAAECLHSFRDDLTVIIHSDRDGRTEDEVGELERKLEGDSSFIHAFVTKHNDIEGYFCSKEHVALILDKHEVEDYEAKASYLVEKAIKEVEQDCLETYLNRYLDKIREARGEESERRRKYFGDNRMACLNGHKLLGSLTNLLQSEFGIRKKELLSSSIALKDEKLVQIATNSHHS